MAEILVTGGAGFIGSHLVDALLARGDSVVVIDDLSAGSLENLPMAHPRLRFVEGDVADATCLSDALRGCQGVVHLAAVASVQASVENPVATHRANFLGTLALCEAMREQGVRRVVYASSAAVYGQNGEGAAIAEDTPSAPLTPYAADKLAGEHYFDFYRREHGLEPAIFRFFNIYGPRQNPASPYSGVISIFVDRALRGAPISVYGDGEQTRDFFYVGDLVQLLLQALDGEAVAPGAVNVGLAGATSLNGLLKAIGDLCQGLPPIAHLPPRAGDIRHSRANNARLLAHYRLPETTPISEGLRRLIEG